MIILKKKRVRWEYY